MVCGDNWESVDADQTGLYSLGAYKALRDHHVCPLCLIDAGLVKEPESSGLNRSIEQLQAHICLVNQLAEVVSNYVPFDSAIDLLPVFDTIRESCRAVIAIITTLQKSKGYDANMLNSVYITANQSNVHCWKSLYGSAAIRLSSGSKPANKEAVLEALSKPAFEEQAKSQQGPLQDILDTIHKEIAEEDEEASNEPL